MVRDPTDDERKEIADLEEYFDADPMLVNDHRRPCIGVFIDEEGIPNPNDVRASCSTTNNGNRGFEIMYVEGRHVETSIVGELGYDDDETNTF
jgi:hypothetical protein